MSQVESDVQIGSEEVFCTEMPVVVGLAVISWTDSVEVVVAESAPQPQATIKKQIANIKESLRIFSVCQIIKFRTEEVKSELLKTLYTYN